MEIRHNAPWLVLAAILIVASSLTFAAPAGAATAGRLEISRAIAITSERVIFSGRLPVGHVRPIYVERLSQDGRWYAVGSGRTGSLGGFRVAMAAPRAAMRAQFRVTAPAGRYDGSQRSRVSTPARLLVVVRQSAHLSVDATGYEDLPVRVDAGFSPARPGRPVILQRQVGTAWINVGRTTQSASGTVFMQPSFDLAGTATLRAVTLALDGAPSHTTSPQTTRIATSTLRWASLTSSPRNTCGIGSDGTAWCWGDNEWGQIGDGTTTDRLRPTPLPGANWTSVDLGAISACGVQVDGTGWCWGDNTQGQLGDGTRADSFTPVQVPGDWASITVNGFNACGVRQDGTGWCWGNNWAGQIGNDSFEMSPSPTQLSGHWGTLSIVADNGLATVCGLQTDSSAWCWGLNDMGQVGIGSAATYVTSPARLPGDGWVQLSMGLATGCGLRTDGTAWCWGDDSQGQVGDGDAPGDGDVVGSVEKPSPVQLPGTDWLEISVPAGGAACGIRQDRTGWCWGPNYSGSLGDGTATDRTSPTRVVGDGWLSLSPGRGIKSDGSGWSWGSNFHGHVGDGTLRDSWVPVRLPGNWSWLDYGRGIQSDYTGWLWGPNQHGTVGNGTTETQRSPVRLLALGGT